MTPNDDHETEGRRDCPVCDNEIEEGDRVIPLDTFRAEYRGNALALDRDMPYEIVIHVECLGDD